MFTMQQAAKNQNNKTKPRNILQSLISKYALKNMQSSRALFIILSLLRHKSKGKTCKEYLPKSACK